MDSLGEVSKEIYTYGLAAVCAILFCGFASVFAFIGWFLRRYLLAAENATQDMRAAFSALFVKFAEHETKETELHQETRKQLSEDIKEQRHAVNNLRTELLASVLKGNGDA